MTAIGDTATVIVDGQTFTGTVYHVRENGWPCVQTPNGHIASGPAPRVLDGRTYTGAIYHVHEAREEATPIT